MKSPLRIERERRHLTLEQLGKLVDASGPTIHRLEQRGIRNAKTAIALSKILKNTVTLEQILLPADAPTEARL